MTTEQASAAAPAVEKLQPATSEVSNRRRKKRGYLGQQRRKKEQEILEREEIPGVPNWATKQLERNARYGELLDGQVSERNRKLVANGLRKQHVPGKSKRANLDLSQPKTRTRAFINSEISFQPTDKGRYAIMGGNKPGLCSNYVSAFTTLVAANTACLLAYKEGSYPFYRIIDRGPQFIFHTHSIRK